MTLCGTRRRAALVLVVVLTALIFCGCSAERETAFLCMGTLVNLKITAGSDAPLNAARELLERYDALLAAEGSGEVASLNRGEAVSLNEETRRVLELSLEGRLRTGCAFSPGVLHASRAWGFSPEGIEPRTPEVADLDAFLNEEALLDNLSVLALDEPFSLPDDLALDFGAIAKGWAGDQLYSMLKDEGVSSAILSLGGNIVCIGSRPDGSPWRVGLAHPRQDGVYVVVEADDVHVVTSADDQRYYMDDQGRRVCHILDPRTMTPARAGLISVTVIARAEEDMGAWADILTTAAFVLGRGEGLELLENFEPRIAYVAMTEEGEILTGGDPGIAVITFP